MGDAAKLARVSRQWLAKLVAADEVPGAAKIAGRQVFDRSQFDRWAREYVKRPKKAANRRVNRSLNE